MAIVIKGASRGNAGQMAAYILAQGKNELSQVHEVRGTLADDPRGALAEMAAIADGSRCRDFLYHAQINPEKGDRLTPEQWRQAVDTLEKNLKLEGHQRVVFEHVKDGRQHYHVVWNRVDIDTLKAVNMGNNYKAHEKTGVELEKAFGLEQLERRPNLQGGRRSDRAPESWEYRQAEHTGLNPRAMKAEVKALREASANGKAFAGALAEHGYILAKGKSRDFIVIDSAGEPHSLGRFAGMKADELREFMRDVDRAKLPTEQQVKAADREGVSFHHTPEPPSNKTAAAIFEAFQKAQTPEEFAAACQEEGIFLARVTLAEARESAEVRSQAEAEGAKRLPLKLRQGEIVAVNPYGSIYRLNERTTGAEHDRIEERARALERNGKLPTLHEATASATQQRDMEAAQRKAEREVGAQPEASSAIEELRRRFGLATSEKQQTPPPIAHTKPEPARMMDTPKAAAPVVKEVAKVAAPVKAAVKVADKLMDVVDGLLDFFAGAPPQKKITPAEYMANAEARQEYYRQKAEAARREKAIEQMAADRRDGRTLAPADLRHLNQEDLKTIKAHGLDDGVKMLIEQAQRQRERERRGGRERER